MKKTILSMTFNVFGIITQAIPSRVGFSLDAERAKNLKPFLRLELSGTLSEWASYHGVERHDPTMDDPFDTTRIGTYVAMNVAEIRVVDSRHNTVVAVIPAIMAMDEH